MKEEISKFYFIQKKYNGKYLLLENNIFQMGSVIVKALEKSTFQMCSIIVKAVAHPLQCYP